MKEKQTKQIIKNEKLERWINWFDEKNLRENQVGIKKANDTWQIYMTDDKASMNEFSQKEYSEIEMAFDALIERARYLSRWFS